MLTKVPVAKKFVAVTLSEIGAKSFRYLQDAKPGERQVYYIDAVRKGSFSGATMLLGQFVAEFEKCPREALALTPGLTNRLYFGELDEAHHIQGDKRVIEYDDLTSQEIADTRARLTAVGKRFREATVLLNHL